jgi:gamma-glutamyltranspeptidase/glutathione hydrolase
LRSASFAFKEINMTPPDSNQIGWRATSGEGIVAAGGAQAVAAGISLLEQGGNAADAAVATVLALSITDHGAFAIGGEVPLIFYDAQRGQTKVLSGLGRAPRSRAAIEWYMEHGIPSDGDIKAAPVPGAIHLCMTALSMYGTKSFADVVAPTLDLLAQPGPDWYPRLHNTLERMVTTEQIAVGERHDKLAAALQRCYQGDIADELEEWYIEKGSFLRKADLEAHRTTVEDPVTVEYNGYTICKCGPWTQGPYLCQALRLLEGFDLGKMGHLSADYIHVLAEALKLAMADRDEYYGDPTFADVPLDALLGDTYTDLRRGLIDLGQASDEVRPGDPYGPSALKGPGQIGPGPGGTTTCVVADRWGNVVSATPSCNVFGDKGDGGATGITHGNRLRSLNTTPGHPNCIQPGKRPRITLTPTMVLRSGKPIAAISVAGGDLQDQTTLNLLLDWIEFGMMPDQAVVAPRFATNHHQDSFDPQPNRTQALGELGSLVLDDQIDGLTQRALEGRGHRIDTTSRPIAAPVMAHIDPDTGLMYAAGDPKAGRHAAGL